MNKLERTCRLAGTALIALVLWGCGSEPALKRAMPLDGVVQLPPPKNRQVATYRCTVDLQSGQAEVKADKRSGRDEESAWNNLSTKLKQGETAYEIVVEAGDKSAKGSIEWALVTVVETQAATGKLVRKLPVQEFWGPHDRHTPRALMMKDGRFQFFMQFWPAE